LEYERAVEAGLLKKGATDLEDPFSRHSGHSIWDMSLLASAIHLEVDPYRDRHWLEQITETLDDLAIEIDLELVSTLAAVGNEPVHELEPVGEHSIEDVVQGS
jgi:hypothetical protein